MLWIAAKPRVVDERGAVAALLDGQHQREAILGDQLVSLPHVVCHLRSLRHLSAGQEGIDEVIHQDGYVGSVDWL
jgi:hypothetical protein